MHSNQNAQDLFETMETGIWPGEWTSSMFITLPKKGDLKQCKIDRTIALLFHASKIILQIIVE